MIYLVSFPRSGSTWIRLFFEKYTGLPSGSIYENDGQDTPIINQGEERCIIRSHHVYDLPPLKPEDKLIFLFRNPVNAIPSQIKFEGNPLTTERVILNLGRYIDLLWSYVAFHTHPKLLIYYEGMLRNFRQEALKILTFADLEVDDEKIKRFIDEHDSNFQTYLNYFSEHGLGDKITFDDKVQSRGDALNETQRGLIIYRIYILPPTPWMIMKPYIPKILVKDNRGATVEYIPYPLKFLTG